MAGEGFERNRSRKASRGSWHWPSQRQGRIHRRAPIEARSALQGRMWAVGRNDWSRLGQRVGWICCAPTRWRSFEWAA